MSGTIRTCWRSSWARCSRPTAEIWNSETVRRLMDIPEIKGMKHSSLDRLLELERLAVRDAHRPDFRIYTGNDLGINMIEYGSDYLLGLAAFAPEKFAERDRLWEAARPASTTHLSDALQYLGNVAFRAPRSGVQTFCRSVPKSHWTDSQRSDAPQQSTASCLGSRNHGGLRPPVVSALAWRCVR